MRTDVVAPEPLQEQVGGPAAGVDVRLRIQITRGAVLVLVVVHSRDAHADVQREGVIACAQSEIHPVVGAVLQVLRLLQAAQHQAVELGADVGPGGKDPRIIGHISGIECREVLAALGGKQPATAHGHGHEPGPGKCRMVPMHGRKGRAHRPA